MFEWLMDMLKSWAQTLGLLNRELTLVLIGLDNAGKTTLLRLLSGGIVQSFPPTTQPNMDHATVGRSDLKLYDLGGHPQARGLWKDYAASLADAIVFIVDAADVRRFNEARVEINKLLLYLDSDSFQDDVWSRRHEDGAASSAAATSSSTRRDRVPPPPVAIIGNKIDKSGAVSPHDFARQLGIESDNERVQIFMMSVVMKMGVRAPFEWLNRVI
jgi:GTPase SAR1 family protein